MHQVEKKSLKLVGWDEIPETGDRPHNPRVVAEVQVCELTRSCHVERDSSMQPVAAKVEIGKKTGGANGLCKSACKPVAAAVQRHSRPRSAGHDQISSSSSRSAGHDRISSSSGSSGNGGSMYQQQAAEQSVTETVLRV